MKKNRFVLNAIKNTDVKNAVASFLDNGGKAPVIFNNDGNSFAVMPGFCDVHVHFREPGFTYKETILSGSRAAAHGGYTTVCTMPNLSPVPDSYENLKPQLDAISEAAVEVLPYGSISVNEDGKTLAALDELAPLVVGFSDDGRGVTDKGLMREAMLLAKRLGKPIAAHCEDKSLIEPGGCIHDGDFARKNGFPAISSESEYAEIERDLPLVRETGVDYHVCHVSTKESVEGIRRAKAEGINITAETGPHYLVLTDADISDDGRFKMNPPLRSSSDKKALIDGIIDGTIDMIATDHAPHSAEEKAKGLRGSAFGVVGLETAFAVMYTELVMTGIITPKKLAELMSYAPRKRFGIKGDAGFTVFDITSPHTIEPQSFLSMGKSSPFSGRTVYGKCLLTVKDENILYTDSSIFE